MTRLDESTKSEKLKKILLAKVRRNYNCRQMSIQRKSLSAAKRRLSQFQNTVNLSRNLKKIVSDSTRLTRSKSTRYSLSINKNSLSAYRKIFLAPIRINLKNFSRQVNTFKNQKPNPKWSCVSVQRWLLANGLSNLCAYFQKFNGMDMMRLSEDDVKIICGQIGDTKESSKMLSHLLFNKINSVDSKFCETSLSETNGKQLLVRFNDCNYYMLILLDECKVPHNLNDVFIHKLLKNFEQLSKENSNKSFTVFFKLNQSGENLIIKLSNKNINLLLEDNCKYSLQIVNLNANRNNVDNQTKVNLLLVKD